MKDGPVENFVLSLERAIDGRCAAADGAVLSAALAEDARNRTAYVEQLRVDALLREQFLAEAALCRARRRRQTRLALTAASVAIAVGLSVLWFSPKRTSDCPFLSVVEVPATAMTQDELELCKARYASDRSFVPVHACPVAKYEPGSIANPGAAIRILEVSSARQGVRLHAGDRVWRSELSVDAGRMTFSLADDTVVTMVGPATMKIHDEQTLEVVCGNVLADAKSPVSILGAGLCVTVAEASVGVVANGEGVVDLLVTDGLVMLDRETCLRPGDGLRHRPGVADIRYRRFGGTCGIRNALLAGVTDIRIERIRHAL